MAKKIVIAGAVRTAIGRFGGALSSVSAQELGAVVIKEALKRAKVPPRELDEVLMGCVIQAGLGQNVARQALIVAGVPETVSATTINNVCGSSLKCVNFAAAMIALGQAEIVVAGGMENMSAAPYLIEKARFGYHMNNGVLKDAMISDALWDAFGGYHMGITAENIAERYGISRREQDEFAVKSQQKCEKARKENKFANEIVPIMIKNKKDAFVFDKDEHPRDGVTLDSIEKLRPSFKPNGTVTAANASGINDGAAAVVLLSEEKAAELGVVPMAYYVDGVSVGLAPEIMGLGAAQAAKKTYNITGYTSDDMSLIEANEAFASQSIACARLAGWDKENFTKVNVNGGAISLGHPVGASGCRILVTLLHELKRRGGGKGLATLCVGGGMGVAVMVEI